jgi:hypothetical protein
MHRGPPRLGRSQPHPGRRESTTDAEAWGTSRGFDSRSLHFSNGSGALLVPRSRTGENRLVQPELPTGTARFLSTDIEGSTWLVRESGDGYFVALTEHKRHPAHAPARVSPAVRLPEEG